MAMLIGETVVVEAANGLEMACTADGSEARSLPNIRPTFSLANDNARCQLGFLCTMLSAISYAAIP